MHKLMIMTVVTAVAGLALYSAAPAERLPLTELARAAAKSECRIVSDMKYDYEGKPYIKKVRICA
jgi:hypothetical protein